MLLRCISTVIKSADLLERRACEMPVESSNPFQSTNQLVNQANQINQPANQARPARLNLPGFDS